MWSTFTHLLAPHRSLCIPATTLYMRTLLCSVVGSVSHRMLLVERKHSDVLKHHALPRNIFLEPNANALHSARLSISPPDPPPSPLGVTATNITNLGHPNLDDDEAAEWEYAALGPGTSWPLEDRFTIALQPVPSENPLTYLYLGYVHLHEGSSHIGLAVAAFQNAIDLCVDWPNTSVAKVVSNVARTKIEQIWKHQETGSYETFCKNVVDPVHDGLQSLPRTTVVALPLRHFHQHRLQCK